MYICDNICKLTPGISIGIAAGIAAVIVGVAGVVIVIIIRQRSIDLRKFILHNVPFDYVMFTSYTTGKKPLETNLRYCINTKP